MLFKCLIILLVSTAIRTHSHEPIQFRRSQAVRSAQVPLRAPQPGTQPSVNFRSEQSQTPSVALRSPLASSAMVSARQPSASSAMVSARQPSGSPSLARPQSIPQHLLTITRTTGPLVLPQSIPQHLLTITRSSFQIERAPQSLAQPLLQPAAQPSAQPLLQPAAQPSAQPLLQPAAQPSAQPLPQPLAQPLPQPAAQPVVQPSSQQKSRTSFLSPAQRARAQHIQSLRQSTLVAQGSESLPRFDLNAYSGSQSLPQQTEGTGFSTPTKPLKFAPNLPQLRQPVPESAEQAVQQKIETPNSLKASEQSIGNSFGTDTLSADGPTTASSFQPLSDSTAQSSLPQSRVNGQS